MKVPNFDKIRISKIHFLVIAILDSTEKQVEHIRSVYLRSHSDYDEVVDFLTAIHAVELSAGKIEVTKLVAELVKAGENENSSIEAIRTYVVNKICSASDQQFSTVEDFFSRFKSEGSDLVFRPDRETNLRLSGLRNFLIDCELLDYYSDPPVYRIRVPSFSLASKFRRLDPESFNLIRINREKIGYLAELAVLEYEKARLSGNQHLLGKIRHISIEDVSAGYDILSFESETDGEQAIPRMIEVKAISEVNSDFFWSRNEINTAKAFGSRYWLYLLPVLHGPKFSVEKITLIQNPIESVLNNVVVWGRQEESIRFWKNNSNS